MRNPSAAQINKLHQSEQLKADEGLSLLTTALAAGAGADGAVRGSAGAKISTPDRHIAAGLLAACMAPFPHAAKKDRRELSSTTSASAGAAGGATIATTTTHSGSAAAAVAKVPNELFTNIRGLCMRRRDPLTHKRELYSNKRGLSTFTRDVY